MGNRAVIPVAPMQLFPPSKPCSKVWITVTPNFQMGKLRL